MEYRGYDSAGVATVTGSHLHVRKQAGRVAGLADHLGRTRAGHGRHRPYPLGHARPRQRPQRPPPRRRRRRGRLVHNGVIENYAALKRQLQQEGVVFRSDTDTEVIAHLIARRLDGELGRRGGRGAAAAQGHLRPGRRQPARAGRDRRRPPGQPPRARPGRGQSFLASDPSALAGFAERAIYLEDQQMCVLTGDEWQVFNCRSAMVTPSVHTLEAADEEND